MPKKLHIEVQSDFLESLTRVSGVNALAELIWNSLDADSSNIDISYTVNELRDIVHLEVADDGHSIDRADAESLFQNLGGSPKRYKRFSPGRRILHGKEGKGRFRAFALGNHVEYTCRKNDGKDAQVFKIIMDRNDLNHPEITNVEERVAGPGRPHGVVVSITNTIVDNVSFLRRPSEIRALTQKLALYYHEYKNFIVSINGEPLDFTQCIANKYSEKFVIRDADKLTDHEFCVTLMEWNFNCEPSIYYTNSIGVAFDESKLGMPSAKSLSVYLGSQYIEDLLSDNRLNLNQMNPVLSDATEQARDVVKRYLHAKSQRGNHEFLEELKRTEVYPYKEEAQNSVEAVERQVFDIVAVQLGEHLNVFNGKDSNSKRLILRLVKEALENKPSHLERILKEVINLPDDKAKELSDLLETTSLITILDTMKEVVDRLRTIHEFRLILFEESISKRLLERRHLHKIVVGETWIFGDDYTYGADDVNLRNVLRKYLEYLGRPDFEEIIESVSNSDLEDDIPDVCLWRQYNRGHAGEFENLVIELKRPSKSIGAKEIDQVIRYAREVSEDPRFPKSKTTWKFLLLATKMDKQAERMCNQRDRKYGHVDAGDNVDVYVQNWADVLSEAEARHQYLKEKLQYSIAENDEGIRLLKEKYRNYLPADEVFASSQEASEGLESNEGGGGVADETAFAPDGILNNHSLLDQANNNEPLMDGIDDDAGLNQSDRNSGEDHQNGVDS